MLKVLPISVFFIVTFLFAYSENVGLEYDDDDDDEDETVRGNEYIDRLLHDMMKENGHEYDPYPMEDSSIGFHKKVVLVNVSGEAKLHNGVINGLTSLHRADHCTVINEEKRIRVTAELAAGVLDFKYDGTVKFMSYGPTITVNGQLAYVEVHMVFTVDADTGRNGKLEKFYIHDMKGMEVKITGLYPLNWALNYLVKAVTTIFQTYVRNFIEEKVEGYIAERLPNYQFPVA